MRTLIYTPSPSPASTGSLRRVFKQCGIHSDICSSSDRFLYLSMTERYAAVIVQENFRPHDLYALYAEWKKAGCGGLFIVLSPDRSALNRGQALAEGIDRYYIEPYSYTSLVKEVALYEYAVSSKEEGLHSTNHFEVDVLRRTITFMGQLLDFTKTEFEIFSLLIRKKGLALSRVQIWEEVWGYDEFPLANTIDVHINRLRKKLPMEARPFLRTVYGIGYRVHTDA